MGIGWGGFAQGLTAGSTAAARAYQAKIDAENQEFLQGERARELETRGMVANASAPAELATQQGLQVTKDDQSFYIPATAKDAAATYAREGYTVAEAPTNYQEVTAGGRTLGQRVISPEHAELGYEPARGLQQKWDEDRTKRVQDVYLSRGDPTKAAAYGAIKTQELEQEHKRGQIAAQPGERALREAQTGHAAAQTDELKLKVDEARITAAWYRASESPEAAIKHYNENHHDGSTAEIKTDPRTGMQQLVQMKGDKQVGVLGTPFKTWDGPGGGQEQLLMKVPEIAKETHKLRIQHAGKMEEIAETGRWHQRSTQALINSKDVKVTDKQRADLEVVDQDFATAQAKGDHAGMNAALLKGNMIQNQIRTANRMAPVSYASLTSARDPATMDAKTRSDVIKNMREAYPNFDKLPPAQQLQIKREFRLEPEPKGNTASVGTKENPRMPGDTGTAAPAPDAGAAKPPPLTPENIRDRAALSSAQAQLDRERSSVNPKAGRIAQLEAEVARLRDRARQTVYLMNPGQ